MLILHPYTFPPLHTLPSFIPADHKITHQWRGNPHSWDSIHQHQRKPERLLVKLLTNTFNTKDSHLGALRCSFVWCWVSSLKTFVNRAFLGSSWKVSGSLIVTAKVHRGFQIWNPSGGQVAMSSLGTRAISEEINWRFPPFVVPGVALTRAVFSRGFGLFRLGGILFITSSP